MKREKRQKLLAETNSKTICTSTILKSLGIDIDRIRYSQCVSDMVRILRNNGFLVRSRKSFISKDSTVGSIRNKVNRLGFQFYLIMVENHVLLLGCLGQTLIDTAPQQRDKRKIKLIYGINRIY